MVRARSVGLLGVRLGRLRAFLRVLHGALGRLQLAPRVPLVGPRGRVSALARRAAAGRCARAGALRARRPCRRPSRSPASLRAGAAGGPPSAGRVRRRLAPKPPTASRSFTSRPARSSSAVSSSSAAAWSVSATFSCRPLPRSPASLAMRGGVGGQLRHQLAFARPPPPGTPSGRRRPSSSSCAARSSSPADSSRSRSFAAPARQLVQRPRRDGRLAQRLHRVRGLALAVRPELLRARVARARELARRQPYSSSPPARPGRFSATARVFQGRAGYVT